MDKSKTKNLLGPYPNETFFMNTLMKLCTCMEKKHLRSQRKQVLLLKLKIYYFHLSATYQAG